MAPTGGAYQVAATFASVEEGLLSQVQEQLELRGLDFLARLTGTTLPSTPPYTVRCVADKTPKVAKEAAKWVDRGVTFTSYLRSEAAQRGEPVELR